MHVSCMFFLGCQECKTKKSYGYTFPNTPCGFHAAINSIPAVFPQQLCPFPRISRGFRGIPAILVGPVPVQISIVPGKVLSTRQWDFRLPQLGKYQGRVKLLSAGGSKKFFLLFSSGEWQVACYQKHLETTTTWNVTRFSMLRANFP